MGKTYEMLVQARRRKLEGVDAVIGVVETHGRVETDLLTKGIETVPKKRIPYKGRVLAEMDLDAILQRRPRLVLVDELAHDNAPGSRHPKRYMDVEELLAAGIDVYTTLNVQHIESLNDVVAKITHVRVRETVPDSILDRADDIELVDLTPGRPAAAAEGRQGLSGRCRRARGAELFRRPAISRPCANWRCAAPPSGWMRRWWIICAPMPSPVPGRRASGCW